MKNHQINPYLSGNYAPVQDELEIKDLTVVGEIPKELHGIYMRNGPNPAFPPISYTYPYDGDGMIHAIYLDNGKANYRNQYVQTKGLLKEKKAGTSLYGGINLNSGITSHIPLDDRTVDIDNKRAMNALVKYDVKTQQTQVHEFGQNAEIGEAVFAPSGTHKSEDDGYLMLFAYNSTTDQSEFIILDAINFRNKPLARIKLPRRIPNGLHGSWMPGAWE